MLTLLGGNVLVGCGRRSWVVEKALCPQRAWFQELVQEVQGALWEDVERVGEFAYLRVVFAEHTLESELPHCSAPGMPFTLGMMGLVRKKVQSSMGENKRMWPDETSVILLTLLALSFVLFICLFLASWRTDKQTGFGCHSFQVGLF